MLALPIPARGGDGYFDLDLEFVSGPEPIARNIPGFHFPHLCHARKDGFNFWAYFIDHSGLGNEVGLARSNDGLNFEYVGRVIERGADFDSAQASFADVALGPQNEFHALYEGKRGGSSDLNTVCWAVSRDGRNFDKMGPVIAPNNAYAKRYHPNVPRADFATVDVGTPTLVWDQEWHVYFHGFTGRQVKMGYAHGPSLDALEVNPQPIIDNTREVDSGTVGSRTNIINGLGGWRYMAYEQCTYNMWGSTRFEHCWWSAGLARAREYGGPWHKMNGILLPRQGNGPGNSYRGMAYEPNALLEDGDKLWIFYRNVDGNTNRIGIGGL